jgi:CO/xanthine dehydrogenase FAD-binding subunit
MLTEVAIPPLPPRTGWSFLEIARRHGDYAQVGVAALVTLDDVGGMGRCRAARLVYLSVGDGPVVAEAAAGMLVGEELSPAVIEAAADKAANDEMDPLGDIHATPEFKRHLARVLTGRALRRAADRAVQERIPA